jgi:hypothetical protein
MTDDRVLALAQIALSILYTIGYFTVLILFMLGYARVPVDYKEAFAGLLSILSAAQLAIIYFWFQRTRQNTPPQGDTP